MNKSLIGAFAVFLLTSGAQAADLYQPDVVQAPQMAPEVQVSEASGWYIRGDAGYDIMRMRGAHYYTNDSTSQGDHDFTTASIKNTGSIGGGVGYQYNNYLRGDLTMDYGFRSTFNGSTQGSCGASTSCTSSDIAHMSSLSLLANAYVDLGTYGSITPYVGAGIGATHISWDGDSNTSCANNGSGCDNTFHHEGRESWRFTYALMAGAAVDITCNLKADVGYRYRHIDSGSMFGSITTGTATGGPGYDKGFDIHEVRGGLRYSFGDSGCGQVAYVPPAAYPQPVYK